MNKICIILLALSMLLCSCNGKGNNDDYSTDIFSDTDAADALNSRWLFLPEKARLIRAKADYSKSYADFSGCECEEITEYARQIFNHLISNSDAVFDAGTPFKIEKTLDFKQAELTLDFAGTAYAYYYIQNDRVYLLVINYYGCGNGTYGNGKSNVTITDETETMNHLLKE